MTTHIDDPVRREGDVLDTLEDSFGSDIALDEPTTRWEYRAVLGGGTSVEAVNQINQLGDDGWELVTVLPPQGAAGQIVLYLKRQKR